MKRIWYHQFMHKMYGYPLYALSDVAGRRLIKNLAVVDSRIIHVSETEDDLPDAECYYIRELKLYVCVDRTRKEYPKRKVQKIIEKE